MNPGDKSIMGYMCQTSFIADDLRSGRPVSRAKGSCIKRSTKGEKIRATNCKLVYKIQLNNG